MFGWFIRKEVDKKFLDIHTSLQKSFSSIKGDMGEVSKWISHFKEKHDSHQEEIVGIIERLGKIEQHLGLCDIKPDTVPTTLTAVDSKNWDMLTDVQQNLAWIIFTLNKEAPESWHTLREVGAEFYPNRSYEKIRTTVAQYLGILEDFGFVERKRTSTETWVRIKKEELPKARAAKGTIKALNRAHKEKKQD